MSTFTVSGQSLTRLARRAATKAAWLDKLARNTSPKLNRLASLLTMLPESFNPDAKKITLLYIGSPNLPELSKNMLRIQRVLGVTFRPDNSATVMFSRMTVEVEIRFNFIEEMKVA